MSNDERHHLKSLLMRESLVDRDLQARTSSRTVARMMPNAKVVKVGGGSIIDRGSVALSPLVEAFGAAFADHKLVIGTGGGMLARHVLSIGLDLGLPTGVLAQLAVADALGNAHILGTLLAPYGVVAIPPGTSPAMLMEAGNYMSARLSGRTLAQAHALLDAEIREGRAALDQAAQDLVARGLALWSRDGSARPVLIVRGQANLIDANAADDLERVRQLLDELEDKEEIARLLDGARSGAATKVFIGSENKLFSLSGSSVIAAPYRAGGGRVVGVVGVIGPTRLNYARIVPMVDFTAQTLTRLMR